MPAISSHYSHDIEQSLIGLILQYPDLWADLNMLERKDFNPVRQRIFDLIKGQLDLVPQQSVSPLILVEKLKSYGQSEMDVGGADMLTYLEGLANRGRMIEKKEAMPYLKELKKLTMKRDLMTKCDEAKRMLDKAETFDEMTKAVEGTLTSIRTDYFTTGKTSKLFTNMRARLELSGAQKEEDLGYIGVIPSIDSTLGPLLRKGSFCNISARSGNGKSSFGFYYAALTAERHNLPVLWLDAGEMTEDEIEDRACCCFSEGKIPLNAVIGNGWRHRSDWTEIMRTKIFPRAEKLGERFHYQNVSGMTAKEKIAFVRRFYFNEIGRGNFLIIVDDYLKAIESMGENTKEYQSVGYYCSDMKALVTTEINAGFMTFTQTNRFGVTKGKKASDIQDNDSVISLSDRIKDNCTANFLMRYKVAEELAREKNLFGNVLLKCLKIRQARGKDYPSFAAPIKMAGGGYAEDYFNLDYHGFHYRDMGRFSNVLSSLGQVAVDLSNREGNEQMP